MDHKKSNIIDFASRRRLAETERATTPESVSPGAGFADAIRSILSDSEPRPSLERVKDVASQVIEGDGNMQVGGKPAQQSIKGNGNVQIGGGVNALHIGTGRPLKVEMAAPDGTIGADPTLRARIESLIKQVNDYRYQRLGKAFRFAALHGELAKAFGMSPKNWKSLWLLDRAMAPDVIGWLQQRLDNTQQGRIDRAAGRRDYAHTRGHLFAQEKEYLLQLGWDDEQAREQRYLCTGKASRRDMSNGEFQQWVSYLYRSLGRIYGESDH